MLVLLEGVHGSRWQGAPLVQERVRRVVTANPQLLSADLESWYRFLVEGFQLPPDAFAKLAADCPALLTQGDVFTAGRVMLFFKGMGWRNKDIKQRICGYYPQLLLLDPPHDFDPVIRFLERLDCRGENLRLLVWEYPRIFESNYRRQVRKFQYLGVYGLSLKGGQGAGGQQQQGAQPGQQGGPAEHSQALAAYVALVFFDLLEGEGTQQERWVELVVKAGDSSAAAGGLSVQDVRDIRDSVKLGDLVRVSGTLEAGQPHGGHGEPVSSELAPAERPGEQPPSRREGHSCVSLAVGSIAVVAPWRAQPGGGTPYAPRPAPRPQRPQAPALHAAGGGVMPSGCAGDAPGYARAHEPGGDPGPDQLGEACRAQGRQRGEQQQGGAAADAGAGAARGGGAGACKFWAATGHCPKGAACRYEHAEERGGARGAQQTFVRARRAERLAAAASLQGLVHEAGDAAKRRRAVVLAEWLLRVFGREALNAGSGVVDVAGGRGELTFALLLQHGVRCTLLEPRPAKLSKRQHRELAVVGVDASGFALPQLRARLTPQLWAGAPGAGGRQEAGVEAGAAAAGEGGDAAGAARLLSECSLLVGLHPDQATDPVLEAALHFGKPFALVPCCVFARQFRHRVLRLAAGHPLSGGSEPAQAAAEAATDGAAASAASASASAPGAAPRQPVGAELQQGTPAAAVETSTASPGAAGSGAGTSAGGRPHVDVRVESYPQLVAYLLQRAGGRLEQLAGAQPGGERTVAAVPYAACAGVSHGALRLLEEGADEWAGNRAGTASAGALAGAPVHRGAWGVCRPGSAPVRGLGPEPLQASGSGLLAGCGEGQPPAATASGWSVGVSRLAFEGANQVVYRIPAAR